MSVTTIFTCSIYPDLTRVWYHFARRYTDPTRVEFLIYDCGSHLDPSQFAGARIVRRPNHDHGRKIDLAIARDARSEVFFLTDDDSFLVSDRAEPLAASILDGDERCAAVSFRPRGWWEMEVNGSRHPVMGSYSLFLKVSVFRREELSFRTRPTDDLRIRRGSGYYDTGDYAQEQLLRRGYTLSLVDEQTRRECVRGFSAVSSGFVNFARRSWLSRNYSLSRPRAECQTLLAEDRRTLEWACGIAAAVALHRRLFPDPPRFDDFFDYAALRAIADQVADPNARDTAVFMVEEYKKELDFLMEKA